MNIFVSNISFKVREYALSELFSQYGQVTKVRVIKDKQTHRSRGYGFVEMPNDQEGNNAINALNGTTHYGRNIIVAEARGRKMDGMSDSTESAGAASA